MSLADLIAPKLKEQGFSERGGIERLRTLLRDRHGVDVAYTTVHCWVSGDRTPMLRHLLALLDVLGIRGELREACINVAGGQQVAA